MEKNGAISNCTPCCGGSCKKDKKLEKLADNVQKVFPSSKGEADSIDNDLTKKAIDLVQQKSN